jgi:ATP phosphoribosyltransferase
LQIRIALPKGRLLNETSELTRQAGWELSDYSETARLYHLTSNRFSNLSAKIFHEKDIPIQVAMGNYDLGICGLDWIQELLTKYPAGGLIKIKDLGYGDLSLFLAGSQASGLTNLEALKKIDKVIEIASEYPNLAESMALNCRFKRFNIFPVWGAAESYPPENSDLVLLSGKPQQDFSKINLVPIASVLDSSAFLIANKISWETKDMSELLNTISVKTRPISIDSGMENTPKTAHATILRGNKPVSLSIRFALPDGHQQKHMVNVLNKANLKINDYPSSSGNRRPELEIPDFIVKVIRPQDMPLQVANGKFDIAITGKDWVREHLYKFPSSPIIELVDLKYGWVKIVAAIHDNLPVQDIADLRRWASQKNQRIRLASEYVSIADKYARDNRLGMYRIVPTWGATESFLPDDADLLIENTETGGTLKRHNLRIIDTLFESTACLIANTDALNSPKAAKINTFAGILLKAVEES